MGGRTPTDFLDVDGTRIAVCRQPGRSPGLVWLGGFRSDMTGTKAERLAAWARDHGHACVRHDYSGHGSSGGAFADGTISRWLAQSLAVFDRFSAGPQILVGSSMGAWIALRMAQELARKGTRGRIAGMVLIAPAPDFTTELMEPALTAAQKRDLETKGYFEERSDYSPEPNVYTRALFEDGRANRVMTGVIETHCPVIILQGIKDPDVPYSHAQKLVDHLPADDVTLTLIRDGDHRLSREEDIALILKAVEELVARAR